MDTFNNCMVLIRNQALTRAEMLDSMDVFKLHKRISAEEYNQLVAEMDKIGLK